VFVHSIRRRPSAAAAAADAPDSLPNISPPKSRHKIKLHRIFLMYFLVSMALTEATRLFEKQPLRLSNSDNKTTTETEQFR